MYFIALSLSPYLYIPVYTHLGCERCHPLTTPSHHEHNTSLILHQYNTIQLHLEEL